MADRLVLNFSVPFRGTLWNTLALPAKSIVFLELRDEGRRLVSFSGLHYDSGTFLWKDRSYSERWWLSLLTASDEILLLQRYHPDHPDLRSLTAVDTDSGELRWTREEFTFERMSRGRLYGFTGTEVRSPACLDLATGIIMDSKSITDSEDNKISGALRPFLYPEGTPYFTTVRDFLSTNFDHRPEGGVEYLEFNGKVVISYHIRNPDGLTNYLLVIRESGAILLHEKMADGLRGLGTDTFFVLSGCLFFVMNRELLLSYQLL